MVVNLANDERALLVDLVEGRMKELYGEIRRARVDDFRSELRQQRTMLGRCLEQLRESGTQQTPSQRELFDPEK